MMKNVIASAIIFCTNCEDLKRRVNVYNLKSDTFGSDNVMDRVEEKRKQCLQFLHELYRLTEGDESVYVNIYDIGKTYNFDKKTILACKEYLAGKGLLLQPLQLPQLPLQALRGRIDGLIAITHKGVKEVEEALIKPQSSTKYFPPVSAVHIINVQSVTMTMSTPSSLQTEESRRGINISATGGDLTGVGVSSSGNIVGKNISVGSGTKSVNEQQLSRPPDQYAPPTDGAPFKKLIGNLVQGIVNDTGKDVVMPTSAEKDPTMHDDVKSKTETKFEKYPYATFPNEIVIGDIAPLKIIIKAVQVTPIIDAPIAQGIGAIKITASSDAKEVPIRVYVEQDNFEVVGGIYYNTILVPTGIQDSKPVIFDLKAKKEGKQSITIQFFQQGTYIGELKVNTTVLYKAPVYGNMVERQTLPSQSAEISWNISKIPPKPDIMLYIYEKKRSPEYEYEIWLNSAEYENYPIGSKTLMHEAESRIRAMFDDIENMNLPADIFDSKMKAKGRSLYKELFSDELKRFYWQNRDRITSFQVITKDPWIPWEIIKPWDIDTGQEDLFLCERYAFSRWTAGKKTVIPNEHLNKVLVVVPSTTDLANSIEERNWIEQYGKTIGVQVSTDSKYRHVVSALEKGEFDIFHFSTHGKYNKDHPLFSQIELEDGLPLRPEDIGEMAVKFRQAKPIVILNTCQSGVQGFSLTDVKSWATQFLDAGASVFIGTLWRVSDKAALRFTQELYKQLSAGIALGEAVQKARTICKEPGDSSWLAYELYGQPNSYIKLGDT